MDLGNDGQDYVHKLNEYVDFNLSNEEEE